MKLTARQREGISIIEPKGKITIGKGDIALRDAVQEALKAGSNNILINLKKATRIDSSGMGELICASWDKIPDLDWLRRLTEPSIVIPTERSERRDRGLLAPKVLRPLVVAQPIPARWERRVFRSGSQRQEHAVVPTESLLAKRGMVTRNRVNPRGPLSHMTRFLRSLQDRSE